MTQTEPVLRVAAKAVIQGKRRRVLIIREAKTGPDNTNIGQWGLPGGRLAPGEPLDTGLKREVREETSLDVEQIRTMAHGEWNPVIRGTPHQIFGIFVLCRAGSNDVRLSEEHNEHAWILPWHRDRYPMMEPDGTVLDDLAGATRPWWHLRVPRKRRTTRSPRVS